MFTRNPRVTVLLLLLIYFPAQEAWAQAQKRFAYIKQFYKQVKNEWQPITPKEALAKKGKMPVVADVDYVQMLSGKAAIAAAIKRGDADTSFDDKGKILDVSVPNDYYIVNNNTKIRQLYIAPYIIIEMLKENTSSPKGIVSPSATQRLDNVYRGALIELTINRDTIVKIKEVYLP